MDNFFFIRFNFSSNSWNGIQKNYPGNSLLCDYLCIIYFVIIISKLPDNQQRLQL